MNKIRIMKTDIQLFKNDRFGEVRVTEIEGIPYFVGRDVATALGYEKPYNAITQHVDSQDTLKQGIPDNQGFIQDTIIINESGLYSLIFGSKLETSKDFKRWVTSEVLPSIRKHGGYMASNVNDTDESIMARALVIAQATIERNKLQLEQANDTIKSQAPKVLFADAVATSDRSVLVSELAKILKQNGIEIGQNRLFIWLRENGYLCSKGEYYNQPTQKAMELGLFELKKTSITKPDGSVLTTTTTKVSGKGQIYFVNKFLNAA
jgi:phage antirepressor YoqD-like protein